MTAARSRPIRPAVGVPTPRASSESKAGRRGTTGRDRCRPQGPLRSSPGPTCSSPTEGAEEDFEAARADLDEIEGSWRPIDEPGLGDESFAATSVGGGVRYFLVFWREDNATATLNVNGFDRKLALADVLELARKQEDRVDGAAGS